MTEAAIRAALTPAMAAKMAAYWDFHRCDRDGPSAAGFAREMAHRYPHLTALAGPDPRAFGTALYDAALDVNDENEETDE